MTRDEAVGLIRQSRFSDRAERLLPLLSPCARLSTRRVPEADVALGASRFGGWPDLAADLRWPTREGRPLTFLAQLRLADLAGIETGLPLPAAGWLWIFYDCYETPWGFDPSHAGGWAVVWREAATPPLVRTQAPPWTPPRRRGFLWRFLFGGHPAMPPPAHSALLTVQQGWTLPDDTHEALEVGDDLAALDAAVDLVEAVGGAGPRHQVGGHPALVQGDPRLECQLVSHGIACGDGTGYEHPRRAELEAGAEEWRLLLQIDTDEAGPGWMWGDAGRLYFWIRTPDLAARAFERTWCVLQCC